MRSDTAPHESEFIFCHHTPESVLLRSYAIDQWCWPPQDQKCPQSVSCVRMYKIVAFSSFDKYF